MDKIKLEDLPKELQEAIFIEDCHISGMHDPTHTPHQICESQLTDLAKRVLLAIGINLDIKDTNRKIEEMNKIPRKLTSYWYNEYYTKEKPITAEKKESAKILENWRDNGFKLKKK